ncbi:MAG: phosphatidylserine decarboxylase [Treponema sp.]|nr:phosphatidylserine decarboxylase [Treponema sp.]
MRIPLTRYGMPQVLIFPLIVSVLILLLFIAFGSAPFFLPVLAILLLILFWMLSFFRNPSRIITIDEKILLSPADGTVTDIDEVDCAALGGSSARIGIFLSVFNVHINRFPCSARVEKVNYTKGKFINAASPDASRVNESNDILLERLEAPKEKLLIRQITGAVARKIVCEAKPGDEGSQGEPFGMIKFGSRTELYTPKGEHFEVLVKKGDKVRAGLTPLIRYL